MVERDPLVRRKLRRGVDALAHFDPRGGALLVVEQVAEDLSGEALEVLLTAEVEAAEEDAADA